MALTIRGAKEGAQGVMMQRALPLRLASAGALAALALATLGAGSVLAQDEAECPTTTPEENIAIVEAYEHAHDTVDSATIDQVLHDEYTDDHHRFGLEIDEASNADEHFLAEMIETLYPGSEQTIDEIFAVDDKVVVATTLTVTQHTLSGDGSVAQLETPAEMSGISIFTVECGMIRSGRTVTDLYELLAGLGFTVAPAMS